MNYESLTGLVAVALGVLLTLAFQAHQKALKAVKEAKEAVESVNNIADSVRRQIETLHQYNETQITAFQAEIDKRIQKLEFRVDDVNTRVAQLQIKR